MAELTYAQVSQVLKYDPETGKIFWLPRSPDLFLDGTGKHNSASRNAGRWNGRFAGKEAFTARDLSGYFRCRVFDTGFYAHRVAWLLTHKEWPSDQIDHINGDRSDNRISNLRSVSNGENCKNKGLSPSNTSGAHGVTWCKAAGKWQGHISVSGRAVFLGYYTELSEAISVRKKAEIEHGYHESHGSRSI